MNSSFKLWERFLIALRTVVVLNPIRRIHGDLSETSVPFEVFFCATSSLTCNSVHTLCHANAGIGNRLHLLYWNTAYKHVFPRLQFPVVTLKFPHFWSNTPDSNTFQKQTPNSHKLWSIVQWTFLPMCQTLYCYRYCGFDLILYSSCVIIVWSTPLCSLIT